MCGFLLFYKWKIKGWDKRGMRNEVLEGIFSTKQKKQTWKSREFLVNGRYCTALIVVMFSENVNSRVSKMKDVTV